MLTMHIARVSLPPDGRDTNMRVILHSTGIRDPSRVEHCLQWRQRLEAPRAAAPLYLGTGKVMVASNSRGVLIESGLAI